MNASTADLDLGGLLNIGLGPPAPWAYLAEQLPAQGKSSA